MRRCYFLSSFWKRNTILPWGASARPENDVKGTSMTQALFLISKQERLFSETYQEQFACMTKVISSRGGKQLFNLSLIYLEY